jgi:threonine aldolase
MRQVGVLAAAGLVALEEGPRLLPADHENAQMLARGLAKIPSVQIDPEKVQTNIVMFDVSKTALSPTTFVNRLAQRGVLGGAIDAARVRLVTHRDVSRAECEQAVAVISETLGAGF